MAVVVRVQGAAELAAGLARARQAIADDTEPATAVAGVIASHATPPVRTGYLAGSVSVTTAQVEWTARYASFVRLFLPTASLVEARATTIFEDHLARHLAGLDD